MTSLIASLVRVPLHLRPPYPRHRTVQSSASGFDWTLITSSSNAKLKLIKRLHSRRQRERLGLVLLEGNRLVMDALGTGVSPEFVIVRDGDIDDADNNVIEQLELYVDSDNDGYGSNAMQLACFEGGGLVANSNDCDDGNNNINPNANEVCDGGVDNDCDGDIDDGDSNTLDSSKNTYYEDIDGDDAHDLLDNLIIWQASNGRQKRVVCQGSPAVFFALSLLRGAQGRPGL